jgi:hypothetical protein
VTAPNRPKIAEGVVTAVSFPSGDPQRMVTLDFAQPQRGEKSAAFLLLGDPETHVTIDGHDLIRPGSYLRLQDAVLQYLLDYPCSARVWVRPDFDGTAVRAEFTTTPEATP